ncbi:hypothetical protein AX018_107117 [Paracidovorax anthurii]|uniref:4-amino-4-deoxy-L-arabinose transferase-like glycosyltransferase n=2 Tax=Paracidovorax anthurii TaxID=78229 RepID=A0A328YTS4_9BURK|nr:hypothetical protein [Paracidovorax anthurii]RAR73957.1 hypothetical protein AX018_107117 [Paracidovorax anthurii]
MPAPATPSDAPPRAPAGRAGRLPLALLLAFTAVYALLTAVAAWRTYTPVPVWDMWGAIDFYADAQAGVGWQAWWRLFNEHRLVLAKTLFWMEYAWFGGQQVFLLAMNYVLVACGVATFHAFLRERLPGMPRGQAVFAVTLLGLWLFSWVQKENLSWAFQSQFFLAQLLPLAGFYALYRAARGPSGGWFAAACALGVLSVGTMINGIMALPMMVLYAAVARLGWRRAAVLALLAAGGIAAYTADYAAPPTHGSVLASLRGDPLGMVRYTLLYLGSPFLNLAGHLEPSWMGVGQAFGLLFVALAVAALVPALRDPRAHRLELALLTFVAYIGGIAFATAGGRMQFGLENAVSSRYTTPTLMAWAALAILHGPWLAGLRGAARALRNALLVLLLALMIGVQNNDIRRNDLGHMRMTGALALEMGVRDGRRIGLLIWDPDLGTRLTRKATEMGFGVFGTPALAQAAQALGTPAPALPARCHGFVDTVESLPGEPRFLRVHGALLPEGAARGIDAVRLVAADGTVAGYGLPDRWRKRTPPPPAEGPTARYLMFTAYLRVPDSAGPAPSTVTLQAPGTDCAVALRLPAPVPEPTH